MLLQSLFGGVLIGLAAVILLLGQGKIAGISGIFGNVVTGRARSEGAWRLWFLLGFIAAPVLALVFTHRWLQVQLDHAPALLIVAGLLVGFGTQLGSGCTSGHGVCGLGNLSQRSLVAVLVFMGVAAITVFVTRHLVGG